MTEKQIARCRQRLERFLLDLLEPMGRSERRHWGELYVRGLLQDGDPEIDRADGRPVAGWERAGDAAVRRAEPLGVGGSLGAAGKADDGGVGNRIRPGLWTTPGFPNKARIPWV